MRARPSIVEIAAALIAAVLFVVLLTQIVLRTVGSPLVWVEEFSTIAFVCLVFTGAAAAFRRNDHLEVGLFYDWAVKRVPNRAVRVWDRAIVLLQILFLGIFAAGLVLMTRQAWNLHAGSLSGFRYGWLYLAVFIVITASLAILVAKLRRLARQAPDTPLDPERR